MSIYVFGRAIGGLVMAWGTMVLFVYFIPVFYEQPTLLIIFAWAGLLVLGTAITRLLDWRNISSWKKDATAVVSVLIVFAVVSFLLSRIFG